MMVLPVVKSKRRIGLNLFTAGMFIGFFSTFWTILTIRSQLGEPARIFTPLESIRDPNKPGILVIYSGPLLVEDPGDPNMNSLLLANFDWFLRNGIDCQNQDTVIIVGQPVFDKYKDQINQMDDKCKETNHRIKLEYRHPECLHLGSMSLVLHEGFIKFDDFDFFIFVTSSMTGPVDKLIDGKPWTEKFTSRITDKVKLVGLSHLCDDRSSHVLESAFCLDKDGMALLRGSEVILDCEKSWRENINVKAKVDEWQASLEQKGKIFQVAMSKLILERADFAFSSVLREPSEPITRDNRQQCVAPDLWTISKLKEAYGGNMPTWSDVIFFKTIRYLPPDIAEKIGFHGNATWIWE